MAASTISATEDFVRIQFAEPIESKLPLAPTFTTILNTLLTETALHVGSEEVRGSKCPDPNRFTAKLALRVLAERYSHHVLMLILNLNEGAYRHADTTTVATA